MIGLKRQKAIGQEHNIYSVAPCAIKRAHPNTGTTFDFVKFTASPRQASNQAARRPKLVRLAGQYV